MNWRWIARRRRLRDALRLQDERAHKSDELDELAAEVKDYTNAVHEMARQSRVGMYRTIRVGRR